MTMTAPLGPLRSRPAGSPRAHRRLLEDAHDGTATFEIAFYRSFAASFARLVQEIIEGLDAGDPRA